MSQIEKLWSGERMKKHMISNVRTAPTVKYGGGNVKCWGYMSSSDVGNLVRIKGSIRGEKYRDFLQKMYLNL